MADQPLFLASSSPRRRQLLAAAGIDFEPVVAPVDEEALTAHYRGSLGQLGEFLARVKAIAARNLLRADGRLGLVLASDTTVLLDGRSLPKPRDLEEAESMLRTLRGREHVVATGVALMDTSRDHVLSGTSATRVLMRDYGAAEIAAYVASGDPLDKAGAYSIQHPTFHPVAELGGCHLGVVGLPVCIVAAMLGRGALPPVSDDAGAGRCIWSERCTPTLPGSECMRGAATIEDGP
jgi:septum formation protein